MPKTNIMPAMTSAVLSAAMLSIFFLSAFTLAPNASVVGLLVGLPVGWEVGARTGDLVGDSVRLWVGPGVGAEVGNLLRGEGVGFPVDINPVGDAVTVTVGFVCGEA